VVFDLTSLPVALASRLRLVSDARVREISFDYASLASGALCVDRNGRERQEGRAQEAAEREAAIDRRLQDALRAISKCAATAAAITGGSLPAIPGAPIGQTSLATRASANPAVRSWLTKRARLVAEPITPT